MVLFTFSTAMFLALFHFLISQLGISSQLCGRLALFEVNFALCNLLRQGISFKFCFDILNSTDLSTPSELRVHMPSTDDLKATQF